jgi:predicted HTH domain antitoxin
MKTKTIRLPDDILRAIEMVEVVEKIEEATAIRKMLRTGFETFVADLYRGGRLTLRESAELLNRSLSDTIDLFLQRGVKGNLDASDVLGSIEKFAGKR